MKLYAAVVPLFVAAASLVTAGPVNNSQPYYREKTNTPRRAVKPRQAPGAPSIVNAASFLPGVSPGGLASIFGSDLSDTTGDIYAGANPLPNQLADVMVLVNNVPAPIYSLANGNQINFQVPYETPVGSGAALVSVLKNGDVLFQVQTDSFTEDPGIFTYGDNYAVAEFSDYTVVGPNNPASPGDILVLYTTGLGPLDQDLVDGFGSPTSPPFAMTLDPYQVEVNGEQCEVVFSGLAPGFVGLYQVNFVVPSDAPAGNLNLQIFSQYANSNTAVLPVQ